jgi:hypothetical protein
MRAFTPYVVFAACASVAIGMATIRAAWAGQPALAGDGYLRRVQGPSAPSPAPPPAPSPAPAPVPSPQAPQSQGAPPRRAPLLNTLSDIGLALEICWEGNMPPPDQARPGMMVTVMLTFTRAGQLLGEPRFTFTTREATSETRALYQRAVVAAINTCTPLPLSEGLGNAIAGRPVTFPFVDRRNQKGA